MNLRDHNRVWLCSCTVYNILYIACYILSNHYNIDTMLMFPFTHTLKLLDMITTFLDLITTHLSVQHNVICKGERTWACARRRRRESPRDLRSKLYIPVDNYINNTYTILAQSRNSSLSWIDTHSYIMPQPVLSINDRYTLPIHFFVIYKAVLNLCS